MSKEFSTFADGSDCKECAALERKIATLTARLAAAEAANKRLEDKNNWLHGALAQAQATAERLENRLALLGAIEDEAAKGWRDE